MDDKQLALKSFMIDEKVLFFTKVGVFIALIGVVYAMRKTFKKWGQEMWKKIKEMIAKLIRIREELKKEQEHQEKFEEIKQNNQNLEVENKKLREELKEKNKASFEEQDDCEENLYCVPLEMVVFKQNDIDSKGDYTETYFNTLIVKFLTGEKVTIRKLFSSENIIQNIESISHPDKFKLLLTERKNQAVGEIEFDAIQYGQEEIVVLKSSRVLNLKIKKPDFSALTVYRDKNIRQTLYGQCLKTPYHKAVGVYTVARTERLRFVICFPKGFMPSEIKTIQINSQGKRFGEDSFKTKRLVKENLWIVECNKPEYKGGVYAYWVWPKEQIEAIEKQKPHPLKKE